MNAHTPGPWKYIFELGFCGEMIASNGTVLAAFVHEPNDADVQLMEAAPDMLGALEAILPWVPKSTATEGGAASRSEAVKAADRVRAAIAKATGDRP